MKEDILNNMDNVEIILDDQLGQKVEELEKELQEVQEQEDEMMQEDEEIYESSGCKCGQCSGKRDAAEKLIAFTESLIKERETLSRDYRIEHENCEYLKRNLDFKYLDQLKNKLLAEGDKE